MDGIRSLAKRTNDWTDDQEITWQYEMQNLLYNQLE